MSSTASNSRIARNTLFLYIRQFVIMGVTFYTFRMVLELLGVEDYGTYNVIGGVIVLFSFISGALTQSTQRYLSFHIGKNDMESLKQIFSMSINIYILASVLILTLAETIGLWFINSYMNFPTDDLYVVNIVYQFTIVSLIFQLLQLPYQSAIIAFERMNFFAYLSILEAALKLAVVLILFNLESNRLIGYAISLSGVSIAICLSYRFYCTRKFDSCKYIRIWNKQIFRELTSFSGWNLLGSASNVATQQGLNILFNIFIGVSVNAAMGISNQVCGAVNLFVTNFQTAFNPQIIKLYAANELQAFYNLIFRASRISFFLLFIIGFPIIVCCESILNLWLTTVPPDTLEFIQLMMIFSLIDALSGPLWVSAQASGFIRGYMILMSAMIFFNIPLAYILLNLGFSPIFIILIRVILNFIIANVRIFYLKYLINLPVRGYYTKVMTPILSTCIIVSPLPLYLRNYANSISTQIVLFIFTFILALFFSYLILLTKSERIKIMEKFHNNYSHYFK